MLWHWAHYRQSRRPDRKVNEDIYLVGVDALTEAVQNVLEDKQTGTVFNDHQARMAADSAVQF